MRFIALVSAFAILPTVAGAQPADSFRQLQLMELLKLGEDVTVVYGRGQVVEGRALDISSSTLTLMTAGVPLELDEAAVHRIRQSWRDSTRDGALFGFALGSVPWWVLYLSWAEAEMEPLTVKGFTTLTLLSAASGIAVMLVGVTMDAGRMQEREIYRAPDVGRSRTSFGPLLSRDRLGAAVTVAW